MRKLQRHQNQRNVCFGPNVKGHSSLVGMDSLIIMPKESTTESKIVKSSSVGETSVISMIMLVAAMTDMSVAIQTGKVSG